MFVLCLRCGSDLLRIRGIIDVHKDTGIGHCEYTGFVAVLHQQITGSLVAGEGRQRFGKPGLKATGIAEARIVFRNHNGVVLQGIGDLPVGAAEDLRHVGKAEQPAAPVAGGIDAGGDAVAHAAFVFVAGD